MCSLLLVCAVLKTLHLVERILNEEECTSIGKSGVWWRDVLAIVLAVKSPGAVQETLGILKEYKGKWWCRTVTKRIKSKLCSACHPVNLTPSFSICTSCSYFQHVQ